MQLPSQIILRKKVIYILIILLPMGIVGLLMSPSYMREWMPWLAKGNDKIQHFVAFFALGVLSTMAWTFDLEEARGNASRQRSALLYRCGITFGVLTVLGVFSEIIQQYASVRGGDVKDFYADAAGSVLGVGCTTMVELYLLGMTSIEVYNV
jgi:VanZ family protein